MKTSANRAIETFLIITFPLALFAGCTGNGDTKPTEKQAMAQESMFKGLDNGEKSNDPTTASTMKLLADTLNAVKMRKDSDESAEPISSADSTSEETLTALDTQPTLPAESTEASSVATPVADDSLAKENNSNDRTVSEVTKSKTEDTQDKTVVASSVIEQNDGVKAMDVKLQSDATAIQQELNVSKPNLHIINFDTDKTNVDNAYLAELKQHALFLKAHPDLALAISGHADNRGSHAYNEKLSLKRAQEIYKLLLSYGVPESQLIVDSYGDASPLHSQGNYQENRRVELEYLDAVKMHLSVR